MSFMKIQSLPQWFAYQSQKIKMKEIQECKKIIKQFGEYAMEHMKAQMEARTEYIKTQMDFRDMILETIKKLNEIV